MAPYGPPDCQASFSFCRLNKTPWHSRRHILKVIGTPLFYCRCRTRRLYSPLVTGTGHPPMFPASISSISITFLIVSAIFFQTALALRSSQGRVQSCFPAERSTCHFPVISRCQRRPGQRPADINPRQIFVYHHAPLCFPKTGNFLPASGRKKTEH